jgi:hypothetical protein
MEVVIVVVAGGDLEEEVMIRGMGVGEVGEEETVGDWLSCLGTRICIELPDYIIILSMNLLIVYVIQLVFFRENIQQGNAPPSRNDRQMHKLSTPLYFEYYSSETTMEMGGLQPVLLYFLSAVCHERCHFECQFPLETFMALIFIPFHRISKEI